MLVLLGLNFILSSEVRADLKVDSFKNGEKVRKVFQQVVDRALKYTVEIFVDERSVAYGTIIDSSGLIISKASEIQGRQCVCMLSDATICPAEILAEDPDTDLVLLKIDHAKLPVVEWSDKVQRVGQIVATVTNTETPTAFGIISAPARKIPAQKGSLGVSFEKVDNKLIFTRVFNNSSAAKIGVQRGDALLKLDGKVVTDIQQIRSLLNDHQPGDQITLETERDGKKQQLQIRMGEEASVNSREFMTTLLLGQINQRRGGFDKVIQHDAPLGVRECGGPLIGLDGKAMGINVARADRVETFALPADIVQLAIARLLVKSKVAATTTVPVSTRPAPAKN
jgi:serine protease Do